MCKENIFIYLIFMISPIVAQAQSINLITQPSQIGIKPINCEHNIARLDIAHDQAGEDGLIILIARLGNGEQNRELNRRRLHSARTYLAEYRSVRDSKKIVTAEGERVSGYGRIEIYVGGKLLNVLAVNRNAGLSVGSCEPEELDDARQRELRKKLYPWNYARQKKNKLER